MRHRHLTTLLKRLHPDNAVVGFDPDPRALARARRKAARAAVSIQFDQGFGDGLPYPEASFDRVFSSFMFHYLPHDEKGKTLRAIRRVLKPDGEFRMLDFEGPEDGEHCFLAPLLHSSHRLKDNSESRVLAFMSQAGFADPKKVGRRAMLFASEGGSSTGTSPFCIRLRRNGEEGYGDFYYNRSHKPRPADDCLFASGHHGPMMDIV